jgi:hypothetical protein
MKANLIKQYAQDTVRYLRNSDNRASTSFNNLLKEGKENPGYAHIAISCARKENSKFLAQSILSNNDNFVTAISKQKEVVNGIQSLWLIPNKELEDFITSFQNAYPKTWRLRNFIADMTLGSFNEIVPAAQKRVIKRIFYLFSK